MESFAVYNPRDWGVLPYLNDRNSTDALLKAFAPGGQLLADLMIDAVNFTDEGACVYCDEARDAWCRIGGAVVFDAGIRQMNLLCEGLGVFRGSCRKHLFEPTDNRRVLGFVHLNFLPFAAFFAKKITAVKTSGDEYVGPASDDFIYDGVWVPWQIWLDFDDGSFLGIEGEGEWMNLFFRDKADHRTDESRRSALVIAHDKAVASVRSALHLEDAWV